MILYANKKKDRRFTFKKKDKVYLLRRNIKMKKSNNKLNYTKLKSFEILEEKKSINYELNLSASMKIQTESSKINSKSQNVEYEVENILNQQNIKDQSHWLIKWKDYEHIENTWESKKNLKNC